MGDGGGGRVALALSYIPPYFSHLENFTDLGPAEEGQSRGSVWEGELGDDEEILLTSMAI